MWIGMYLIFVLIVLVIGWVVATQILIPVLNDRPLCPIFTVGRAQHQLAAAHETELVGRLHAETNLMQSKSKVLETAVRIEVDHLKSLLAIPGETPFVDDGTWRETCQATLSRLRLAIEEIDAH
jgi:hypothetical protein